MPNHLRLARPVTDLTRATEMYRAGLGLQVLGRFEDHQGFDGAMLGDPQSDVHLEFTHCVARAIEPSPTPEDLLVFYVPDAREWQARCAQLLSAGFRAAAPFNPYWSRCGRTFEDHDGYRVVLQNAEWRGAERAGG